MKLSFKKIFKISIVLMLVAGLSGALIVLVNMVTEPIIVENGIKQEKEALNEIFSGANPEIVFDNGEGEVKKVTKALVNDEVKGYVYRLSGKNAYGIITLLVGISSDGKVTRVVFLENGQSFAPKVEDHVEATYQNGSVNSGNIDNVDTHCGATYGAKLVKSLISSALEHFNNNFKGGDE